jgi:hypothetical protein
MAFIGIVIPPIYYIYIIIEGDSIINNFNNIILQQEEEIIKINNICEKLLLKTINNSNIYIKYYYITIIKVFLLKYLIFGVLIIILFPNAYYNVKQVSFNSIIIIILTIISFISFILVVDIYNCLFRDYINLNIEKLGDVEKEIINKRNEINNFNKNKIFSIIDSNISISNINYSIDEYMENYQYINKYLSHIRRDIWLYTSYDYNSKKNKRIVIFELRDEMIKNKRDELMTIMKTYLKDNNIITPDLVKMKLEEVNNNLEDYKKSLELKINELIGLCHINEVIISIN